MTETKKTMDAVALMRKHLEAADGDQLRSMVQFMAEALMEMEAEGVGFRGGLETGAHHMTSP